MTVPTTRLSVIWIVGAAVLCAAFAWVKFTQELANAQEVVPGTLSGVQSIGATAYGSLYGTVRYDLDREPVVSCRGWDYAKQAPVGCQPHEWTIEVVFRGKVVPLTRRDLHAMMTVRTAGK